MSNNNLQYSTCHVSLITIFGKKAGATRYILHYFMPTFKVGQVVKFLKQYPDEDPEQPYIVKEVKGGYGDTRIDISPLNLGLASPPVYTVRSTELILTEQVLSMI